MPEQPRGKHTRVVDDEEVSRLEKRREGGHEAVLDRTGSTLKVKQPGSSALDGGLLGYQFRRELEVEL